MPLAPFCDASTMHSERKDAGVGIHPKQYAGMQSRGHPMLVEGSLSVWRSKYGDIVQCCDG